MTAGGGGATAWRIIPRPILETILKNYAAHHRVPNPLLLHGPRGSGKSSLLLHRLLEGWNTGPHFTAYVDFAAPLKSSSKPWTLWPPAGLPPLQSLLERELERIAACGILVGAVGPKEVFAALNRSHGLNAALCRLLPSRSSSSSLSMLWSRAVLATCSTISAKEIEEMASLSEKGNNIVKWSKEEGVHAREGFAALKVAKEIIGIHREWRKEAIKEMNRTGTFSRTLTHSSTDWPCLLMDILSQSAEVDFFQPKLVLNNIDILRKAMVNDDDSLVSGPLYHDSLIWRLVSLAVNERSIPVIFVTSDGYYSYQASIDFGFPDIMLSRETYGWTYQEARLHMVSDYFTESEWKVIDDVLGPNPRQLHELYMLKRSSHYQQIMHDMSSFEDLVDAYLSYLQVTVVNPAMETALAILRKFAYDVRDGKIPKNRLPLGAPWRHPPNKNDSALSFKWAKIQLMDFVQSLVKAEFGLNYLADDSFEIFDDPSALAMLEVGLLYTQRDPSFIRPISRGIQRCLVRWLVQEKMQMNVQEFIPYLWQRLMRGRSYRHLMKEIGYK